jgi:hypothetical protein
MLLLGSDHQEAIGPMACGAVATPSPAKQWWSLQIDIPLWIVFTPPEGWGTPDRE